MAISGLLVLHPFEFFAARDDSSVTLAPEGRQIVAQCVSTGNGFFRPVPGLANLLYGPRARALGYSLSPSGLRDRFFCGAANPGCRRLSAGAGLVRRFARGRKEPPERRLRARLPAPQYTGRSTPSAASWVGQASLPVLLERAGDLRREFGRGCIARENLDARRSQHRRHPPAVLRVLRRPQIGR